MGTGRKRETHRGREGQRRGDISTTEKEANDHIRQKDIRSNVKI